MQEIKVANAPGGVARKFVLSDFFKQIGLFELFMFFWCIAFGVGCEQLIMSTTVACWYFQDDHKVNGTEMKSPNAEKTDEKTDKKQNDEFVTNGFK